MLHVTSIYNYYLSSTFVLNMPGVWYAYYMLAYMWVTVKVDVRHLPRSLVTLFSERGSLLESRNHGLG